MTGEIATLIDDNFSHCHTIHICSTTIYNFIFVAPKPCLGDTSLCEKEGYRTGSPGWTDCIPAQTTQVVES